MEKIREYDHFVDKRGIVYNVKGNNHPENRVQAAMIYLPTTFETNKVHVETGRYYARLIDEIGHIFCARNLNKVQYVDPISYDSFIAVAENDIDQHFSAKDNFDSIKGTFSKEHALYDVLDKLKIMGISEASLGFFGGALVGMLNDQSDVDIIIYGSENYMKWLEAYKEVFKNQIVMPGMSQGRYRDYVGNYPFDYQEAVEQFGNRHCPYKLKYQGVKFDIRFGHDDSEVVKHASYSPLGEIKIEASIVENKDSAFCPAMYDIEVIKGNKDIHEGEIVRLLTYRHNYRHLFAKGENVIVYGMQVENTEQKMITLEKFNYYIKDKKLIKT